jgi:hypothetical protein
MLTGCATRVEQTWCGAPPTVWEAGTNVIVVPASGAVSPESAARLESLSLAIQSAAASAGARYKNLKFMRLIESTPGDIACRPDVVRYSWSGCPGTRSTLIKDEPVTMVGTTAIEGTEDIHLQLAIRNWRVDNGFRLQLQLQPGTEPRLPLTATIPIEAMLFAGRRVPVEAFTSAVQRLRCGVYDEPSFGSFKRGEEACNATYQGRVLESRQRDGTTWLRIQETSGRVAWIPVPDAKTVAEILPEFALIGVVVAFQEFWRVLDYEASVKDRHNKLRSVYEDFRKAHTRADAAAGYAHLMKGVADLLASVYQDKPALLADAEAHFQAALPLLPSDSDLRNLMTIAAALKCCAASQDAVDAAVISATLKHDARTALAKLAADLNAAASSDPANLDMLQNLGALLRVLVASGTAVPGVTDPGERIGKIDALVSARKQAPQAQCDVLARTAQRLSNSETGWLKVFK